MKRVVLNYLVIVAIAVSLGMGLSACGNVRAQNQSRNAAERWEYMQICGSFSCEPETKQNRSNRDIVPDLNRIGNEGWELVSATTCQNDGGTQLHAIVYTLKRKLQ